MEKKSKAKKEIEALYKKIAPLKNRISEIEEKEILEVQRPRLRKMVGYYLRSTYEPKTYYCKILDLVEYKHGFEFILGECHITKEGNPYLHLNNISPYLNKEWWDEEVPMNGWERCSEGEYNAFKRKILGEFNTQKSLRNWIAKQKY